MRSAEENVALSTWFTLFTFPDGDAISELSRCLHRKLDRKGRKVLLGAGQGRWVQFVARWLVALCIGMFYARNKIIQRGGGKSCIMQVKFFRVRNGTISIYIRTLHNECQSNYARKYKNELRIDCERIAECRTNVVSFNWAAEFCGEF